MSDHGSEMPRTQNEIPYIRLDTGHDLRDLAARLISALGGRRLSPTTGTSNPFATAPAGTVAFAATSPAVNASLSPDEFVSLVLSRRGRLYLNQNDTLYRLRFWLKDEWAALSRDGRPVVSFYDQELDCWVGLEPAP